MKARLVVADPEREETTICLAVTPEMKRLGVKNRCRVFEIPKGIDFITAPPRMRMYMERSADVYSSYLQYISPDDIHVYSIDECFIDLTPYIKLYRKNAREITDMLVSQVMKRTGIPATAGIGTNLFLAKVALDIMAKKSDDGIAFLDEERFLKTVAHHRPITDIWNVGVGTAKRLADMGVYDLHGVTELPRESLVRKFGVDADLLIDHANGRESCTIADIKRYRPRATSISHSQILPEPYSFSDARLILSEMIEVSVLELIEKRLSTDRVSLTVGYNHTGRVGSPSYFLPPPTGASKKLNERTNSLSRLSEYILGMYGQTTRRDVPVRNLAISFGELLDESYVDINMFTDQNELSREHSLLRAIVDIKGKYGKNAIVKGSSFEEKSTARERNTLVGGHKS